MSFFVSLKYRQMKTKWSNIHYTYHIAKNCISLPIRQSGVPLTRSFYHSILTTPVAYRSPTLAYQTPLQRWDCTLRRDNRIQIISFFFEMNTYLKQFLFLLHSVFKLSTGTAGESTPGKLAKGLVVLEI